MTYNDLQHSGFDQLVPLMCIFTRALHCTCSCTYDRRSAADYSFI